MEHPLNSLDVWYILTLKWACHKRKVDVPYYFFDCLFPVDFCQAPFKNIGSDFGNENHVIDFVRHQKILVPTFWAAKSRTKNGKMSLQYST